MSAIVHHEIDGERIPRETAESIVFMTIGGGVDTTTALIGAALLHLSQVPDDKRRLIEEPELLVTATEEFLRFYPPARSHARTVTEDFEFAGCPMRAGDRVLLGEISAGRDGQAFPDADEFVIDRNPNRHVSFGVGLHRCVGSHLARIEFAEVITAVLGRDSPTSRSTRLQWWRSQLVGHRRLVEPAGDVHARSAARNRGVSACTIS